MPRKPTKPRSPNPGRLRRIRSRLSALTAILALAAALPWVLGLILNDRYLWSQLLWWIPNTPALIATTAAFALSCLLGKHDAPRTRAVLLVLIVIGAAQTARIHIPNLIATHAPPNAISAAYWNLSWSAPESLTDQALALDADITIIANARPSDPTRELTRAFRERADELTTESSNPNNHYARFGNTQITSRHAIITRAEARMEPYDTAWSRRRNPNQSNGIIALTLDTNADAAPDLTIWIVDLPSDPTIHRNNIMTRAKAAANEANLPTPDIILGDFNAPAHSRSLRTLTDDLAHQHTAATWPQPTPLWAIDLAFTNTPAHAAAIPTEGALHKAIRVQFTRPQ